MRRLSYSSMPETIECVCLCACLCVPVFIWEWMFTWGNWILFLNLLSFSSLYMVYIDCLIFQSDQKSLYDPICSAVLNVPTYLIHWSKCYLIIFISFVSIMENPIDSWRYESHQFILKSIDDQTMCSEVAIFVYVISECFMTIYLSSILTN